MRVKELIERIRRRWKLLLRVSLMLILIAQVALAIAWNGSFERLSYDSSYAFRDPASVTNIVLVYLDDESFRRLGRQGDGTLHRTNWIRFLERAKKAEPNVVLFDFDFSESNEAPLVDARFAQAIRNHGKVVLGSRYERTEAAGGPIQRVITPIDPLLQAAATWGHLNLPIDPDRVVRKMPMPFKDVQPASWMAARLLGATLPEQAANRDDRWLYYPGPNASKAFPSYSLIDALIDNRLPDSAFRDRIIVIGSRSAVRTAGEVTDQFGTPWTRFGGPLATGASVHATAIWNLLDGKPLHRIDKAVQALALLVIAVLLAVVATILRRPWAITVIVALLAAFLLASSLVASSSNLWWNWLIVLLLLFPLAFFAALVVEPVLRPVAFISHRRTEPGRTGASIEARVIKQNLARKGWEAFLDVEDLRAGEWQPQVLEIIRRRPVFIVLLSEDAFCSGPRDALHREITEALRRPKGAIIPLFLENFDKKKAESDANLAAVLKWGGITFSHEFFDDMIERLNRRIREALNHPVNQGSTADQSETAQAPGVDFQNPG